MIRRARDVGACAIETDVLVVGAGGCGLAAAAAATEAGARVVVLEKSRRPMSNTARSGGMIPAAGTRFQRAAGVLETADDFAADIFRKNGGTSDRAMTEHLARMSKEVVEWLVDSVGVDLVFVDDFKYPGHSTCRMHAPPSRTGHALVEDMRRAVAARENATLVTGSPAVALVVDDGGTPVGAVVRQDREEMFIGARAIVLASNGYAGNAALLARHCPEVAGALYFGGEGSTGEAVAWGEALGAELAFMDAYQAHASVAHPHGVLITYAVVMEGGVQVNLRGRRFGDETHGYSEHALAVLAQPEGVAIEVYDARIHALALTFEDYRDAVEVGAVKRAESLPELAAAFQLDADALLTEIGAYHAAADEGRADAFGRAACRRLVPPFYGVKVTGALFHTQGGLQVDERARVLKRGGGVIANLYAGGGAAAGVSGHGAGGYLSGNGLLTALGLGMIAGRDAGRTVLGRS